MATGTVWIAIDLALAADTGRPKHTDPNEQGGWIFMMFRQWYDDQPKAEGAEVLRWRYYGQQDDPPWTAVRDSHTETD